MLPAIILFLLFFVGNLVDGAVVAELSSAADAVLEDHHQPSKWC